MKNGGRHMTPKRHAKTEADYSAELERLRASRPAAPPEHESNAQDQESFVLHEFLTPNQAMGCGDIDYIRSSRHRWPSDALKRDYLRRMFAVWGDRIPPELNEEHDDPMPLEHRDFAITQMEGLLDCRPNDIIARVEARHTVPAPDAPADATESPSGLGVDPTMQATAKRLGTTPEAVERAVDNCQTARQRWNAALRFGASGNRALSVSAAFDAGCALVAAWLELHAPAAIASHKGRGCRLRHAAGLKNAACERGFAAEQKAIADGAGKNDAKTARLEEMQRVYESNKRTLTLNKASQIYSTWRKKHAPGKAP